MKNTVLYIVKNFFFRDDADAFLRISQLMDILFDGFNNEKQNQRMKYDFSLSFFPVYQERDLFRFTYNDRGERDTIYLKFQKAFQLFSSHREALQKLQTLLNIREKYQYQYQTTFGIEYKDRSSPFRFKVFFEEVLSTDLIDNALFEIIRSELGLEGKNISNSQNNIMAIGIDFILQDDVLHSVHIKDYRVLPKESISLLYKSYPQEFLGKGKFFFYETFRYNEKGDVISKKIYKIYENFHYRHFYKILQYLRNEYNIVNLVKILLFLKQEGVNVFPVIFAIDFKDDTIIKEDLYFSFH